MKCPNDGETLLLSERSGIEIDYCPQCRGVWLDRGELDKIVERSQAEASSAPYEQEPPRRSSGHGHQSHGSQREQYGRRKESWLSNLFD
ncbi:MAG: TFIIB-type zinc ribbon-containing protein [Actinomycetales bacterium]|uniref:TFIIB-type zinc ribbon-containing protein n=1 Tax=uncultured Salinibacterium sp. TaxID=459274 RepID=UPI0030DD8856